METLADIALQHLRVFLFYTKHDGIDPDYACKVMEEFPSILARLPKHDKNLLSNAAKRCLAQKSNFPDGYGYNPKLFTEDEEAFLDSLATGLLFDELE